jgi:hypothetical protein
MVYGVCFMVQHFVHNYRVQASSFSEVIGQEPSDDAHEELVLPLTKNSVESPQEFVETKIISVGFEDKNQGQRQSQPRLRASLARRRSGTCRVLEET